MKRINFSEVPFSEDQINSESTAEARFETAEKIVAVLQTIPGAGDVELEAKGTVTVLDISPKKEVIKKMGIASSEVLEAVGIGIGGREVGTF